ncbi:MAG: phage tail family protein [Eggerthellaceae bacterium]|nr:phage tail family protein [Eggerthellaceae bacterium]
MILFDGHDLCELLICGDPQLTALNSSVSLAEPPGADGASVLSRTWGRTEVSFTVVAIGNAHDRRDKLSTLGAWLDVDGPRRLVLPDAPERFHMAVPSGAVKLDRLFGGETGKLTFLLADPIAYGDEHSITVPSGGSVTFVVGGTYPTRPVVTANAVRNASSLVWGLRLDEGDYLHIATGSASARAIVADCGERTLSVNGSAAIPTLDSDWLELEPGAHTLRMDNGTGAATVTWRDRWL